MIHSKRKRLITDRFHHPIRTLLFIVLSLALLQALPAQERSDGCTSITIGKSASFDGSVMTSHTMD
ncbi:MAG: hypothetical protein P8048_13025, partial [Calditrichia bacterium]